MEPRALKQHASTIWKSLLKLRRAAAGAGKSLVAAALLDELPAQWTAATISLDAQTTSLSLQLALQGRMEKRNKARPRPATCHCLSRLCSLQGRGARAWQSSGCQRPSWPCPSHGHAAAA